MISSRSSPGPDAHELAPKRLDGIDGADVDARRHGSPTAMISVSSSFIADGCALTAVVAPRFCQHRLYSTAIGQVAATPRARLRGTRARCGRSRLRADCGQRHVAVRSMRRRATGVASTTTATSLLRRDSHRRISCSSRGWRRAPLYAQRRTRRCSASVRDTASALRAVS